MVMLVVPLEVLESSECCAGAIWDMTAIYIGPGDAVAEDNTNDRVLSVPWYWRAWPGILLGMEVLRPWTSEAG